MDCLDIGERLRVEDQLHIRRSVAQPANTIAGVIVRHQRPIRIGATAPNFGKLLVRQLGIFAVGKIVKQRTRRGILLRSRKLFDLSKRLFEKFGHQPLLPQICENCIWGWSEISRTDENGPIGDPPHRFPAPI
jgi:hypothetical protein